MRPLLFILIFLMLIISWNIGAYVISEDYRFFLKKLKYQQEIVYEQENVIDDNERVIIIDDPESDPEDAEKIIVNREGLTFLEALGNRQKQELEQEEKKNTQAEDELLDEFRQSFILSKVEEPDLLFGITGEYPDEYKEYANKHISLYMFPTKDYREVYNIFKVLSYELPYEINVVDNFWDASFYINMKELFSDNYVRIVFQYQNTAFWLKIKKDNYNRTKEILDNLEEE